MRPDKHIQTIDLRGQYLRLQTEIDEAMQAVLLSSAFINGPEVKAFAGQLADYLSIPYVIPCGNGTDALQMALMALDLQPGDEVIVPAFTYAAAVEMVVLLGLTPVVVDVDPGTFNIAVDRIEQALSSRTRAIIVVHLFGQCTDMEPLIQLAETHHLYVIEDNAQSIGASYTFTNGTTKKAGTMGHIGTTSFFPTKPLACYGDGGAMFTSDPALAEQLRMLTQHGQQRKYHHKIIGCNSRLDTIQAAVLQVKLKHLEAFVATFRQKAIRYNDAFRSLSWMQIPETLAASTHVYHQYTIRLTQGTREAFRAYLQEKGIPTQVYYPLTIPEQEAFTPFLRIAGPVDEATHLSRTVVSLPIHTELTEEEQTYIIETIRNYESH